MPNGDDVQDRFAKRFEDEDGDRDQNAMNDTSDENEGSDRTANRSTRSMSDESNRSDVPAESAWNVENVKQGWSGLTVYLPDDLDDAVDDQWSRLNYVADGNHKKDRHFKPLLVLLGLERMEEMEGEELDERIERMTRMEWLDDE